MTLVAVVVVAVAVMVEEEVAAAIFGEFCLASDCCSSLILFRDGVDGSDEASSGVSRGLEVSISVHFLTTDAAISCTWLDSSDALANFLTYFPNLNCFKVSNDNGSINNTFNISIH